nr:hypothetical protein [Acidobacteriota bacterium]
ERGEMSAPIRFYCERVAFPLLFGLLLLAAIVIPLLHWRAAVAKKQAEAQTKIESDRADLVAESARLRNESQLEHERLTHFEDKIKTGNAYVEKLRRFGRMKSDEREALLSIPEPLRSQMASELGIDLTEQPTPAKPVAVWRGGVRVDEQERGN